MRKNHVSALGHRSGRMADGPGSPEFPPPLPLFPILFFLVIHLGWILLLLISFLKNKAIYYIFYVLWCFRPFSECWKSDTMISGKIWYHDQWSNLILWCVGPLRWHRHLMAQAFDCSLPIMKKEALQKHRYQGWDSLSLSHSRFYFCSTFALARVLLFGAKCESRALLMDCYLEASTWLAYSTKPQQIREFWLSTLLLTNPYWRITSTY
jgi:hypothetical protein